VGPTLLIGIDGATFTVLDPYIERGVTPFLGELARRGTRAELRSIVPALTPPAWTSLVTGKRPGGHGVFDFFQKEAPDSIHFQYTSSQEIRSATIWSLASEQERQVISLNFPLMFPPPPVDGCIVPGGMMPWRQLRLGCHPPGLFDRLKALPGFNPRQMLDMELEIKAIEGCPEDEQSAWVELHIQREQRWFEVARHLIQEEPADLIGVMFDGVDKLQHLCWRFVDPACRPARPSRWEREMIDLCERYFRSLDAIVAELVELAGPDATVVLASDHGFGPTLDVFHVNSWLEREGYLSWAQAENGAAPEDATKVGFAQVTRHVHAVDWDRTLAYAATPSSQGINIVSRVPGTDEALPEEARLRIAAELTERLQTLRRPRDGAPLVTEVWARERAFPGPHAQLGPDLSLELTDGGTISILPSDTLVARRPEPRGHHRPEGVFIASGPGIRSSAEVAELSIVDVAPLILHRLGLPLPDDLEGRLPLEVLEPEELERRPPQRATATAWAGSNEEEPGGLELDPDEEAAVLERLRALGYVE
jgi:predicted AlkP superfamily phosphohydrolase/phosphomutase